MSRGSLALPIAALLAASVVVGCGGGENETATTSPAATSVVLGATRSATVAPQGDPGGTIENVILACSEKNGPLLRTFVAQPVSDEELDALFAVGTDVRLAVRAPAEVEGDRATVEVRLEVTREGEAQLVDRTWELERGADGVWRFIELPDCY